VRALSGTVHWVGNSVNLSHQRQFQSSTFFDGWTTRTTTKLTSLTPTYHCPRLRSFNPLRWSQCTQSPVARLALTGYVCPTGAAGEALQQYCPRPIGWLLPARGFGNDVLTFLKLTACDGNSWSARWAQFRVNGRISREEDSRTSYQRQKSRRGDVHQVCLVLRQSTCGLLCPPVQEKTFWLLLGNSWRMPRPTRRRGTTRMPPRRTLDDK